MPRPFSRAASGSEPAQRVQRAQAGARRLRAPAAHVGQGDGKRRRCATWWSPSVAAGLLGCDGLERETGRLSRARAESLGIADAEGVRGGVSCPASVRHPSARCAPAGAHRSPLVRRRSHRGFPEGSTLRALTTPSRAARRRRHRREPASSETLMINGAVRSRRTSWCWRRRSDILLSPSPAADAESANPGLAVPGGASDSPVGPGDRATKPV